MKFLQRISLWFWFRKIECEKVTVIELKDGDVLVIQFDRPCHRPEFVNALAESLPSVGEIIVTHQPFKPTVFRTLTKQGAK